MMKELCGWLLVLLGVMLLPARLAPAAAPTGAQGEAAAAHGETHEPQLISGPAGGLATAVTTLVVFALLLAILGRFAWKPIVENLRAREQRIRREIADAEAARRKAEATLQEYSARLAAAEEQVRKMINEATAQGEKMAAEIRHRGQKEAEDMRQGALREIGSAKDQALTEIYEKAAELATGMAAKILKRSIRPEDHADLVEEGLEQLSTGGNGHKRR